MNEPLVFVPPAPLFTPPAPPPCQHKNYTLDKHTGYSCDDCGVLLVYCWQCADEAIRTGRPVQHVHPAPEHIEVTERVWKKQLRMQNGAGWL